MEPIQVHEKGHGESQKSQDSTSSRDPPYYATAPNHGSDPAEECESPLPQYNGQYNQVMADIPTELPTLLTPAHETMAKKLRVPTLLTHTHTQTHTHTHIHIHVHTHTHIHTHTHTHLHVHTHTHIHTH
jgi:hypothetical protein